MLYLIVILTTARDRCYIINFTDEEIKDIAQGYSTSVSQALRPLSSMLSVWALKSDNSYIFQREKMTEAKIAQHYLLVWCQRKMKKIKANSDYCYVILLTNWLKNYMEQLCL